MDGGGDLGYIKILLSSLQKNGDIFSPWVENSILTGW